MKMSTMVVMTKTKALAMVMRSRFFWTTWVPERPPSEEPPKALDSPLPLPECRRTKTVMESPEMKKRGSMMYLSISNSFHLPPGPLYTASVDVGLCLSALRRLLPGPLFARRIFYHVQGPAWQHWGLAGGGL